MTNYLGTVYADPNVEDEFLTTIKNGSQEYATDYSKNYFQLKSGGYMLKSAVTVLDGRANADNIVRSSAFQTDGTSERLILSGTSRPPFHINETSGDEFSVTLFNTTLTGGLPDLTGTELFDGLTQTADADTLTLTFSLKDPSQFWGYNIEYDGTDTILYFKRRPQLSQAPGKPLEHITIVLDPGHGGYDSGALGITGEQGPYESQINQLAAFYAKQRLEDLGALVVLTRTEDIPMTMDDRMR